MHEENWKNSNKFLPTSAHFSVIFQNHIFLSWVAYLSRISPLFLLIRFSSYLRVFFSTVYLTFLYLCLSFTLTFTQKYKPAFHSHPSATNAFIVWHSCHTVGLHIFSPSISLIVALLSSSFWQQYVYLLRFSSYPQYFETVSFHFFFLRFGGFLSFSRLSSAQPIFRKKAFFHFFFMTVPLHRSTQRKKSRTYTTFKWSSSHNADKKLVHYYKTKCLIGWNFCETLVLELLKTLQYQMM